MVAVLVWRVSCWNEETRSKLNLRAAARAACTCPAWIGSKVPPKRAMFNA